MKLIILDCDGVLVDSEMPGNIKFAQLLSDRGVHIDEDTCHKEFTGLSVKSIYKLLNDKFHKAFSTSEIDDIESHLEQELFLNVQPIPGVEKLLQAIKNFNLPFCVASNSNPERIRGSLRTAGLLSYFADEHIFSSTIVANGKPAPDIFLHAANVFNYLPENCLVIEDSNFGIQAANAAAMDSIAFFGGQHAQQVWYKDRVLEQKPTITCDTMTDVVNKLQCWLENSYAL